MRILVKLLQVLYVVYAFLLFLVMMIPVFILALLATFWGRIKGGNMIYRLCSLWGDVWLALIFIRHTNIYEKKPEKDKHYIYVANHISYLDAAMIVKAIRQPVRPLGKIELAKAPLFGFIYKKAIVTVDRSSAENRADSVRLLKSMLSKGISVFFFPEGTFNETGLPLKSFYDGAFKIAIETETPIKPLLFLDTYDRMHYSSVFSLNPGKSRAVFLEEIPTEGLEANDFAALREKVFTLMEEKLRAYKASWIT
jgi:1-acyl-sn-glycerol-3-phosphate acyltransferase